jgi:hypothetical protein
MANVNDDQFIPANPMINKVRIASGRKDSDARNVGLASETRVPRE